MDTTAYDDKTDVRRDVEPQIFQDENPEKPIPKVEKVDYSGAHEKTDPKEIALVKKLDRWMMVSGLYEICLDSVAYLSSPCFGACTGSTIWTEMPLPWLVSMISRKISTSRAQVHDSPAQLLISAILTCIPLSRIPNLCFHPVRRLHPRPDPFQHVPHPNTPQPLHGQ